jgi:hypothetical protein
MNGRSNFGRLPKAASTLANTAGLSFYYPLVASAHPGRTLGDDPLFPQQWHLQNTGQTGGIVGADANVVGP